MDFGDELMLESFKFPWLIWIQLIVMFLLFILLFFGFTVLTSDISAADASVPPSSASSLNSTSSNGILKDEDGSEGEYLAVEQGREGDESPSSSKDSMVVQFFRGQIHPCNYFKAIFKCFGLDLRHHKNRQEKQD